VCLGNQRSFDRRDLAGVVLLVGALRHSTPAKKTRLVVRAGSPYRHVRRNKKSPAPAYQLGADWLVVLAHLLDSSHQTHFPGLIRRDRLRELISRAYLAELIDPNSADEDVLNSSFNSSDTDVLNSSSEGVFKTSSAHPIRTSSTHLPKTHSRHLQLISQRRTQLVFRSSSQDVFAG
jgi:hypothetical protein